ncbi:hypothetical protein DPMN_153345 [Dreissena polymorpha]|uniref:Uncharacterized protein n=1 Tax=Dreissena polymorpha TaxID=45954 RepID=A0A9D4J4R0_DREPO|nr:hypothetical protein DPMN_153345 [Dreissena polymorpha]
MFRLLAAMFFTKRNIFKLFHEDRAINVAARVLTRVLTKFYDIAIYMPPCSHVFQPNVTIYELIQDIIGTNLLTKFHEDQVIHVASRVLTRQMLTPHNERRTKGDHKGSPRAQCAQVKAGLPLPIRSTLSSPTKRSGTVVGGGNGSRSARAVIVKQSCGDRIDIFHTICRDDRAEFGKMSCGGHKKSCIPFLVELGRVWSGNFGDRDNRVDRIGKCLRNVNARVFTNQMWMDGRTTDKDRSLYLTCAIR